MVLQNLVKPLKQTVITLNNHCNTIAINIEKIEMLFLCRARRIKKLK